MWVPETNSDFMDRAPWVRPRDLHFRALPGDLMQPARHCIRPAAQEAVEPPGLPTPTSWKVSTAKVPLYGTWPSYNYGFCCVHFFSMTTWSLSANQDKITDNKGLENHQAVSTEATIPHLCKDERCPCTHWTAAGHPNGECQGMVIKGRGRGRRKEPCSETALNSVTTLRMAEKAQQLTDEPGLEL